MKKRLAAILACVLTVSALAACGTGSTNTTENSNAGAGNSGSDSTLAEATLTPTAEIVTVEEGATLHEIPVQDYVVLGDYRNMAFSIAAKLTFTEEEIEEYAKDSFGADLSYADKEVFADKGTVAEGDYVLMDYEGKENGVAFDGGTAAGAVLRIGSGAYIDGFEDGLVGVAVGETVDLNLTFPEDYDNTELAGKAVVFTVTVNGIAQLTDDAVAALGYTDVTTVDQYREAISYMMEYEAETAYYEEVTYAICNTLVSSSVVSKIPSNLYEEQKAYVIEQVVAEAEYFGMDGDTYTNAYIGVNLADYAVTIAEEYAVQAVIFQAIANAENLNPTDEDIEDYIAEFISYYGETYGISSAAEFYEMSSEDDVRIALMQENVIEFISEHATITEIAE